MELLKTVKELETDPKTANISGKWASPDGTEMTLNDTGADTIAFKAPNGSGSFTRTGAALKGTGPFQDHRGVVGQLTVKARIETPDTIVVISREFTPNARNWPAGMTNRRYLDEAGRRRSGNTGQRRRTKCSPTRLPARPQQHRKTHQDTFGSRTNSTRGLHSQDAPDFAAEPWRWRCRQRSQYRDCTANHRERRRRRNHDRLSTYWQSIRRARLDETHGS